MTTVYQKNMKIESGKEYKFAGERLDIFLPFSITWTGLDL